MVLFGNASLGQEAQYERSCGGIQISHPDQRHTAWTSYAKSQTKRSSI